MTYFTQVWSRHRGSLPIHSRLLTYCCFTQVSEARCSLSAALCVGKATGTGCKYDFTPRGTAPRCPVYTVLGPYKFNDRQASRLLIRAYRWQHLKDTSLPKTLSNRRSIVQERLKISLSSTTLQSETDFHKRNVWNTRSAAKEDSMAFQLRRRKNGVWHCTLSGAMPESPTATPPRIGVEVPRGADG